MASDTRPKVALSEEFLKDVFGVVGDNPLCTTEDVANILKVSLESAYLGLRELRRKCRIDDHRGRYFVL